MTRPSTVPLQKARIAVQQAVEALKAETQRWEKASHNDPQIVKVAQYVRTYTKQAHQKISDALDKGFTEKDDRKAAQLYGQAAKVAKQISKEIQENPQIQSIAHNPIMGTSSVKALQARIADLVKHIS